MPLSADAKAKSAKIAEEAKKGMLSVNARGAASAAALRRMMEDVTKAEKALTTLVKNLKEAPTFLKGVESNMKMLGDLLVKAKALKEEEAKKIIEAKKWGPLLPYSTYKNSAPAKPQLIKAVELALDSELKRGTAIADDNFKRANAWQPLFAKHTAACEEAQQRINEASRSMQG